jgi:dihydroorotate dehydrogenase electron transfer subunit
MTHTHASRTKGLHTATVLSNVRAGECFWKMQLRFSGEAAQSFAKFRPGQFIQFDASELAIPPIETIPPELQDGARRNVLLRRPFSFSDVTVEGDTTTADLIYCIVGPASLRMTTLAKGDAASIVGPLGNGFSVPQDKRTALLVVGGMGLPPIRCLAKTLSAEHPSIEAIAFIGARTVEALPLEERPSKFEEGLSLSVPTFAALRIPSLVATDDGSAGHRGRITEWLARWLEENADRPREEMIVYACGPERMLEAAAKVTREEEIDCQVSMERRMACGIGLCQSCAIECRVEGSDETTYKLCCKDGPVFDAREVVFGE